MTTPGAHRPVPAAALPAFTPVPRKCPRHDGWTPERQRAFIEALADTGCVSIAARMVNMSQASVYQLRRQPGAESFRAAMDAAQSLGLQVVKDEAFERAMHGQLIPVFVGGKLMGFRRKKNDRLLMFILRHYGQDAGGRKTTINYFSTRATAGAAAQDPPRNGEGDHAQHGGGVAASEASTTTVKTIISQPPVPSPLFRDTDAANLLNAFEGVPLDPEAQAEIHRALEACAERRRALRTDWDTPHAEALARQAADGECDFIRLAPGSIDYLGELESGVGLDDFEPFDEAEPHWQNIGEPKPQWAIEWEQRQAQAEAAKALPAPGDPPRNGEGDHPKGGGGVAAPTPSPEPPVPSPRQPHAGEAAPAKAGGAYKKRKPKPPFTPPDEARKAQAVAEVAAERRIGAADEAERRRRRKRATGDGYS